MTMHSDVHPATWTTVASYVLRKPKTTPISATVQDMWDLFRDDHVHMALLTRDGHLRGCVTRADLVGAPVSAQAVSVATTHGRTIGPAQPIAAAWATLERTGIRRLAVVDEDNRLIGLLCLKRSRTGFCTDADVEARAGERATSAMPLGGPLVTDPL